MANPTAIDGGFATLAASTDDQEITLNPRRKYSVYHMGLDDVGDTDEGLVNLATAEITDVDYSEGLSRLPLPAGVTVVLGSELQTLHYKAASGVPRLIIIAENYDPAQQQK